MFIYLFTIIKCFIIGLVGIVYAFQLDNLTYKSVAVLLSFIIYMFVQKFESEILSKHTSKNNYSVQLKSLFLAMILFSLIMLYLSFFLSLLIISLLFLGLYISVYLNNQCCLNIKSDYFQFPKNIYFIKSYLARYRFVVKHINSMFFYFNHKKNIYQSFHLEKNSFILTIVLLVIVLEQNIWFFKSKNIVFFSILFLFLLDYLFLFYSILLKNKAYNNAENHFVDKKEYLKPTKKILLPKYIEIKRGGVLRNNEVILENINGKFFANECIGLTACAGTGLSLFGKVLSQEVLLTNGDVFFEGNPLTLIDPSFKHRLIRMLSIDSHISTKKMIKNINSLKISLSSFFIFNLIDKLGFSDEVTFVLSHSKYPSYLNDSIELNCQLRLLYAILDPPQIIYIDKLFDVFFDENIFLNFKSYFLEQKSILILTTHKKKILNQCNKVGFLKRNELLLTNNLDSLYQLHPLSRDITYE